MHLDHPEMKKIKRYMPVLQKAVFATFNSGDWKEFGYDTDTSDILNGFTRLFRSLQWGDPDYEGHVFTALEEIFELNKNAFEILLKKDKIREWIKKNKIEAYTDLYDGEKHIAAFSPQKISPQEVVRIALRDADTLINSGTPQNAVDRMHTAFHGYLKAVCDEHNIAYSSDPAITELFKLIYSNLIKINQNISHAGEIEKILRSHAGSINAINTLRNHASMAHVNELLGKDEATLLINSIRSLLHYLEAKIG